MKFLYASVLTTALLAIGQAGYAAAADDVAALAQAVILPRHLRTAFVS
ncbi:hypothetical protein JZM24_08540 [Candidatus Sodalis endolongispinus]|uniref:Uncharacterized protein n=1 Tax=Candidatus Sodalis endolongispinus TaxID=2812662 RepID=A0ABS5YDH4_9GAMM|nr:hypothetical protein [Candidatus Sodalis endolongispinus]MBT9432161.1 hypothetical protein [Candidatus Sodalis endolongispinus]